MHSIKEACLLMLERLGLIHWVREGALVPISDTDELLRRRRLHSRGHWPDCH